MPKPYLWDSEKDKILRSMLRDPETLVAEVCAKLKTGPLQVRNRMKELGIPPRRGGSRVRWSRKTEDGKKFVRLWEAGKSHTEIAREFGFLGERTIVARQITRVRTLLKLPARLPRVFVNPRRKGSAQEDVIFLLAENPGGMTRYAMMTAIDQKKLPRLHPALSKLRQRGIILLSKTPGLRGTYTLSPAFLAGEIPYALHPEAKERLSRCGSRPANSGSLGDEQVDRDQALFRSQENAHESARS